MLRVRSDQLSQRWATLRPSATTSLSLLLMASAWLASPLARGELATPYAIIQQNVFVQIFGLPPPEPAELLAAGVWQGALTFDLTNNAVSNIGNTERLMLDGETYRLNLAARYGWSERLTIGLDVPRGCSIP